MPDYGQKATDAEFRRLRAKINDIYQQAHKEIVQKGREFAQAHAKREAKLRQDVAYGKMTQEDFDAWMRGQVFQGEQWAKKKQQMADTLYHADQVAQDMINDSRFSVFAENANYMEYSLEHDAGIDMGFGLYDADTVRRLVAEEPDLLPPKKRVGRDKSYQWYNRQIQTAITQGIIQGESIDKIARRIGKQTGETSMTAMLRNAHTMHTGAQNAGRMEGLHQAQKLGINVRKQWMATLDHHTRDAHADLDGQVQDVDAPFKSSLGNIMYPGDPTADPANVWNCRCTLTYVYPDHQPTGEGVIIAKDGTKLLVQTQGQTRMQRRDNETGENIEYMTYREWEQMKRGDGEAPEPEKAPPQFEIRHADFTPAASVKEAEEYASQFMGYNGKVSYRGLSVDAANACNQILADMRANIPGFKLSGIESMNMRSSMWKGKTADAAYRWGGDGKLYINPIYYKNAKAYGEHVAEIDRLMQTVLSSGQELINSGRVSGTRADYISALLETKRQAVSQTHDFMQGTFVHEMGHALDDKYVRRELRELYPGIDGVRDFLSQSRTTYGSHISGYAIEDGNEYIAESFTAWWYGEREKVDPVLSGVFEKVMTQ